MSHRDVASLRPSTIGAGILAFLLLVTSCAAPPKHADLVLRNGRIVTMNDSLPQAQALAVSGELVVAVGSNRQIQRYVGPSTRVIDLAGRLAIPGFIEGHGHFISLGRTKTELDLTKAHDWSEIVAMVAEAARRAEPGAWIVGRGWHQEKWTRPPEPNVEGFPTHDSLSRAAPNHPVLLTHASGHATFVNAKAMELAGISRATPNPPGGEILRNASGAPTGLLRERASDLVRGALDQARARRTPEQVAKDTRNEIQLAARECLSKGVTSFQDAGSTFETIDLLRKMAEEDSLGLRLWVMIREPDERLVGNLSRYNLIGVGRRHLTVRAIKRVADGALGTRGAWLLAPYSDLPTSTGLNTTPIAEIMKTAHLAADSGFQLCVHAIGDRANREVLDIYKEVIASRPGLKGHRWRIEHAQHLSPADIPRFGQMGVIASMQGIHCTSDAVFVTARLGAKRAQEGAYVWRKLLDANAVVINGTDTPVEDVSPIACFYASVTRRLKDGTYFYPEQRMTRAEALRSYTLDAAFAAFEEDIKGSLVPGKLADITVLSKDIMTVADEEIPTTEVVATIVGGKVMYEK